MPDVAALQAALDAVAERHEVLRLHYRQEVDGSVVGVITPASEFHVPLEVVPASAEATGAGLEAALRAEGAAPFDLSTGPLIRAKLFESGCSDSGGAVLCLTLHHAVGDAWSIGVLHRELSEAYAAAVDGRRPAWAALPIQYSDYAAWQAQQLAGEGGDAERQWWREALAGVPAVAQLPLDRLRPSQPSYAAGQLQTQLPSGLVPRLEALAKQLGVNLQAVLLAGLQVVLLRYTGQEDLVVGVPVAGRDRAETHGLVGYFINTLPVRCSAAEGQRFADVVQAASQATLSALAHSLLPLQEVVQVSGVQRMPGVTPLFQVSISCWPQCGVRQPMLSPMNISPMPFVFCPMTDADFSYRLGLCRCCSSTCLLGSLAAWNWAASLLGCYRLPNPWRMPSLSCL